MPKTPERAPLDGRLRTPDSGDETTVAAFEHSFDFDLVPDLEICDDGSLSAGSDLWTAPLLNLFSAVVHGRSGSPA